MDQSPGRKLKAQSKRITEEIFMKAIFTTKWIGLREIAGVVKEPRTNKQ